MDGQKFLQALLDLRGLNPNSMAKKAGNHALQSTVARFLGGNQSRRSTMQPVADFFGVDVGGFYDPDKAVMELRRLGAKTGEAPMHPGEPGRMPSLANTSTGPDIKGTYPLISKVQAGAWTELCDHFQPGQADEWLPSTKNLGKCGYMLRVEGKSMENPTGKPSFAEGMVLHVNPHLDPVPGNYVVVRRNSTLEATFKRYVLIDGQKYLEAINPDWPKDMKYLPLQPGDEWCGVVVDASLGGLP